MYTGICTDKIIWITEDATKISPMFLSTLTVIVCLLSVLVLANSHGARNRLLNFTEIILYISQVLNSKATSLRFNAL